VNQLTVLLLFITLTMACSRASQKPEFTDDYVLIEFAARLEEDYHATSAPPVDPDAKPPVQ